MKFLNPLLAVTDLDKSKDFYRKVLRLHVITDFGANITLTGGVSLQTKQTWMQFIHKTENEIVFGSNTTELYFQEDDFDGFIQKLNSIPEIDYVHQAVEHPWGQRAVRFYDPDKHIIEVGENINSVIERFLQSGLSAEETALRMDVPFSYIIKYIARKNRSEKRSKN